MNEHLDSTTIEELRAVLGSEFAVLVGTFLVDSDKRVVALRDALAAGDLERLREAAHSFKGSSLNMGALALAALCREVETLARTGELNGTARLVEQIAAEMEEVARLLAV